MEPLVGSALPRSGRALDDCIKGTDRVEDLLVAVNLSMAISLPDNLRRSLFFGLVHKSASDHWYANCNDRLGWDPGGVQSPDESVQKSDIVPEEVDM